MGRHAYLITAYDDFYVLECLIGLLADPRNDIYLHVDKRAASFDAPYFLAQFSDANLVLAPRRRVYWGDFSHVASVLDLMQLALESGEYDYLHLLSGSDLPIRSQDFIHCFCAEHQGKEFVAFTELKKMQADWIRYFYPLNRLYRSNRRLLRFCYGKFRNFFLRMQRGLRVDRRSRIADEVRYGSDWFSITSGLARDLVNRRRWVGKSFKWTFIPSEFYMQTFLWNSTRRAAIYDLEDPYRGNLRAIDFARGGGGSPYTWRLADLGSLLTSDRVFARKFDSRVDKQVVDAVVDHVTALQQSPAPATNEQLSVGPAGRLPSPAQRTTNDDAAVS